MTTLSRSSRPAPLESTYAPDAPCAITLRWIISRAALRRARPDLSLTPGDAPVHLEWRLATDESGLTSGSALLLDSAREIPLLSLIPARGLRQRGGGFDHLDIPGLLRLSARSGEPIYAQTEIVHALSLRGGSYELVRRSES